MPNDLPRKWNVFLCDDEPPVLDRLLALSQRALLPEYNAVFHCSTSPDALPDPALPLHIAVLDSRLRQENGISLARTLLARCPACRIIFVSGYPQYVSDVYDVPHLGMVLKDQLESQLPKFLLRAAAQLSVGDGQTLSVLSNRVPLELGLSAVLYLERKDHVTYIHLLSGKTIRTRQKLDELLSQGSSDLLCRCHVSYAVNLSHVAALNVRSFLMKTDEQIPISRIYTQSTRKAFYGYLQRAVWK